jgi:hypothetical protein
MAAFVSGEKAAEEAVTKALAGSYLKKGFSVESLKLKTPELAAVKQIGSTSGAVEAGGLGPIEGSDLKSAKQALNKARATEDKIAEATALTLLASAYAAAGDGKSGVQSAAEGLAIFKEQGSKEATLPAYQAMVSASLTKKDFDGAVSAAKGVLEVAESLGNKKAKAAALASMAAACVVLDDIFVGLKAAEAALALYSELGDKAGQMAVWSTVCDANVLSGKPMAAAKAGKEVLVLAQEDKDKKAEAVAMLMIGDANVASRDSLDAALGAVQLFKELGDKSGEAAALLTVANSTLSQEQKAYQDGIQKAQDAEALFKETGCKTGEALAASFIAFGYMLKEDVQKAESHARDSLGIFRDIGDSAGESYAMSLLASAKDLLKNNTARLLIDNSGVAHIEVNEHASQESLETVIDTLLTSSVSVGCICLHVEGEPDDSNVHSYAVTCGGFLMGLRAIGVPVICACWGKIAGPTWSFIICSDYRIAATSTTFMTPMWGPPEVMGDLLGFAISTKMFQSCGPESAFGMCESGIVHQLQKGKDDTRKVATEMAKRIAAAPTTAQKQTMHLMGAAVEKFALACAKGGVRA